MMKRCTPQVKTFPSNGFLARKDWYDLKIDAILLYLYRMIYRERVMISKGDVVICYVCVCVCGAVSGVVCRNNKRWN